VQAPCDRHERSVWLDIHAGANSVDPSDSPSDQERGERGGWPRVGDYPGLPQIQTCAINASGSSRRRQAHSADVPSSAEAGYAKAGAASAAKAGSALARRRQVIASHAAPGRREPVLSLSVLVALTCLEPPCPRHVSLQRFVPLTPRFPLTPRVPICANLRNLWMPLPCPSPF